MTATASTPKLLSLVADIVAAHVRHNAVSTSELPNLIRSIYGVLTAVGLPAQAATQPEPAVPVKKSVFSGYLVCLEDGQKLKMLKRHLKTTYNMTPAQYRTRWGLPDSYPMVAPDYAAHRAALAKKIGLGRNLGQPPAAEVPVQQIPAGARGKKVGRPRRAAAAD